MAKHTWTYDHVIDFSNSIVIDSGSYRTRKTLESWHTVVTNNGDNNVTSWTIYNAHKEKYVNMHISQGTTLHYRILSI